MPTSTTVTTVLGPIARVVGDLHLDHDAVVAGEITGNVHTTAHLELAADAVVHGDLYAASLSLAGRVRGNVRVTDSTHLQLGGAIQGQLDTGHLVVARGVAYEGQLRLHRPVAEASGRVSGTEESRAVAPPAPKLTLNRSQPRGEASPAPASPRVETNAEPDAAGFCAIPGTVNAGLRPRRRASSSSAG